MTWELAEDLARALGQVAMLTGHPDTLEKEGRSGVRLFAAAPYERGSNPRRVLSWLRYLAQAFFWLWKWPADTPALLFSNPPMLAWLGYLMWLVRGQRYAVMVHDIYPDLLVRLGRVSERHPMIRTWKWMNRRAYEHAEVVMTLGDHMAATLARAFEPARTKAGKIEVVYPWADTETIRPIAKKENWFAQKHDQVGKLTVMYSGNMGIGHDIEAMLAAAEQLQDDSRVHFMFIGAGPKWQLVEDTIRNKAMTNVTLLDWQPEEVVPYSLTAADVAMVSLEEEFAGIAVPSKAFSSLAAGTPLLVICSQETELADIIRRFDCGWIVQPGQVNQLGIILSNLASDSARLSGLKMRSRFAAQKIGSRANSLCFSNAVKQMISVDDGVRAKALQESR